MIRGGNTESIGIKCLMLLTIIIILITMLHHKDKFMGGNNKVIELDNNDFEDTLNKENTLVFIMFYAPWCPHCTNLMDTWSGLAKEFGDDNSIAIAKIDTDKNKEIGQKHSIKGYPTLKLYQNGKEAEHYKGPRNVNAMKQFIKKYV